MKARAICLVTGTGSASVGMEIYKALRLARRYSIICADMSRYSIGVRLSRQSMIIPKASEERYLSVIKTICDAKDVDALAPGNEAELVFLSKNKNLFDKTLIMANDYDVISLCMNKKNLFGFLSKFFKTPQIFSSLEHAEYPVIIKPNSASGGSRFAFLAENKQEARFFIKYLQDRNVEPFCQQYIDGVEYTVGVCSAKDKIIGAIALRRLFNSKLCYNIKYGSRVVSTGVSQGISERNDTAEETCVQITKLLKSTWSLNIQGRLKNNVFYPFEINPRHSGTTYLRALAGFNEPDMLLQYYLFGREPKYTIRPGLYLRDIETYYAGHVA